MFKYDSHYKVTIKMELEQELAMLELSDKTLAERNSKKLLDFLVILEEYAWSNKLKKLVLNSLNPDVKFKVEGRRVYREIHNCGSSYDEEHLDTPLHGIPVYRLLTRKNVEKVPS